MDGQTALPFAHGSATSEAAAKRARAFSGSQRERLIAWFKECGRRGTTRPEAARALEMSENSVRPRWRELHVDTLIYKTPTMRDSCEVWSWKG